MGVEYYAQVIAPIINAFATLMASGGNTRKVWCSTIGGEVRLRGRGASESANRYATRSRTHRNILVLSKTRSAALVVRQGEQLLLHVADRL